MEKKRKTEENDWREERQDKHMEINIFVIVIVIVFYFFDQVLFIFIYIFQSNILNIFLKNFLKYLVKGKIFFI